MVEARRAALLVIEHRVEAFHPPRAKQEGSIGVLTGQPGLVPFKWRALMQSGKPTEIFRYACRVVGEAETRIAPGTSRQSRLAEAGQFHPAGATNGDAIIGEVEQGQCRNVGFGMEQRDMRRQCADMVPNELKFGILALDALARTLPQIGWMQ